ncbi:hypothetical protein ACEWY4_019853 [Coilia grayii]|uniref:Myb/SANT-like DNA-binding domain-containing protein n=1 Tax=Coilia grayii TaxID=363190 RepID=A0ABD1JAX5_9TELE
MTEYYEEGGLLYEHSPPKHIKEESPEGPCGGGISEDGFPREDEDSEGSCDNNGSLPDGLPFNVVVVHPNVVAPGLSSDDLFYTEQNRGVSSTLAAGGGGKRKSRFSGAELEVLVSEVTRCEGELFGPAGRLRRRERERIWAGILERVNAVSRVPRTLREVKKRWDDLKRRNGGRLADARYRSCYLPSSRGASVLGRSAQASPRLQQGLQKQSTRGKGSTMCFSDNDAVGGEGSERDGFEKDDEAGEHDREEGEGECGEGGENSMEDKLGLGLGLGIVPPPTSERWLPPSPLYSAPFLNGTPQPSPQPSLGAHQGLLEAPAPRVSWLEDELRGLGEAAVRLGDRVEQSLREFGEGFRRDMRTLVASQEALSVSLQQNNVLLQRLLGLLESQQQQQQAQHHPQPHPHQQPQQHPQVPQQPQQQQQQQPQHHLPLQQNQALQQPPQEELQNPANSNDQPPSSLSSEPAPPDVLDGTTHPDPSAVMNGMSQRSRRGRTVDQRRRRRR